LAVINKPDGHNNITMPLANHNNIVYQQPPEERHIKMIL